MTAYIVYSLDQDKALFATDSFDRAKEFADRILANGWSFGNGVHYPPVVIWDVWVHDKDCTCTTRCGGNPEDV